MTIVPADAAAAPSFRGLPLPLPLPVTTLISLAKLAVAAANCLF